MNAEIIAALASGIAAVLSGALSALSGRGSILDALLDFIRDFASRRGEPRKVDGLPGQPLSRVRLSATGTGAVIAGMIGEVFPAAGTAVRLRNLRGAIPFASSMASRTFVCSILGHE